MCESVNIQQAPLQFVIILVYYYYMYPYSICTSLIPCLQIARLAQCLTFVGVLSMTRSESMQGFAICIRCLVAFTAGNGSSRGFFNLRLHLKKSDVRPLLLPFTIISQTWKEEYINSLLWKILLGISRLLLYMRLLPLSSYHPKWRL